ncbi:MAG: NADP-dependent malic enzyme [Ruminococcus sp.]|jgi:malate dehydrogenase (oxaloacetate-decarboxylating)|nr:NADP-dependent malic enzyme [Ruminococcus sp.]
MITDPISAHEAWEGKIEVISRVKIDSKEALSVAYTPGVAAPCLKIKENPESSYRLTRRGNLVAVITDGTAVLGLGDIGPLAAMPVMEGKCALFKEFAGVDAFPLCIDTKDTEKFIETVKLLAGNFGGINLEDIAAPRCFEIEQRLKEANLGIPIFHDDQHGTAIVVHAALINTLKLTGKNIENITVCINGAGAAGCAIARRMISAGVGNVILVDIDGIISRNKVYSNKAYEELKLQTNSEAKEGMLIDAMRGADVFVGVSRPNLVTPEMIKSMASKPAVFAMANPNPEIMPELAKAAGAYIVGTGRSDYPNQINNVLAFPGIFKGALASRASDITDKMMINAGKAIASCVSDSELSPEHIIPNPFDKNVAVKVSQAVSNV